MKYFRFLLFSIFTLFSTASSTLATPTLYGWAFNINDTLYSAPDEFSAPDPGQLPGYVDYSGFDWNTGLGNISMTFNPAIEGQYYVNAFFDHEFTESDDSFWNEFGSVTGDPADGQSWEIDEPGWWFGDIFDNVVDGTLDNYNNVPSGLEEDVSLALGWDFNLAEDETAIIDFIVSDIVPDTAFYLSHTDYDTNETLYFASTLDIRGTATPVPEPGTMALLATGFFGLFGFRRKWHIK
ncbi:MAG: PEP-CTERM sorting domain-containing protein [Desulfobacteraceae bacterium]|jgi:hypothetical protein